MFHSSQEMSLVLVASLIRLDALSSNFSVVELPFIRALVLGIEELTLTLPDPVAPVSFIRTSIAVYQSSDTILLAHGEGACVDAAVWGPKLSLALLLIVLELAYVDSV